MINEDLKRQVFYFIYTIYNNEEEEKNCLLNQNLIK